MYRQRRLLYVYIYIYIALFFRRFHYCTTDVKVNLFRAYCTPLYTAPLWVDFKKESLPAYASCK